MRTNKKIIMSLILIMIIVSISVGIYFLLKEFNITNVKTLRKFISNFGKVGWIVFVIIQVIISSSVFVMPLEDELWVTLSILLFGIKYGFILSVIGMILTSSLLYVLGRKIGVKLAVKVAGEECVKKMQQKLSENKLMLPFMYLIPFFPHDSLCLVCGLSKVKFVYFFVVTLLIRSIEIVVVCFLGGGIINWSELSVLDWVMVCNFVIIDIYLLFKLKNYMQSKMDKKD